MKRGVPGWCVSSAAKEGGVVQPRRRHCRLFPMPIKQKPVFASPLLSGAPAADALQKRLDLVVEAAKARGKKNAAKEELDAAKFYFLCSEEYIGPLTAPAIAGWMQRNLKILTKAGDIVAFEVNPIQYDLLVEVADDIARGVPGRYVILKARQFGISTLIQALIFLFCARTGGTTATTIAHKMDATLNLHTMSGRFLRNSKYPPIMDKQNLRETVFAMPHDSRMTLDTAENKQAKRSFTNRIVHMSEIAFWPWASATRLGLVQTVADVPGTFIFEESTANGVGGPFYDLYWSAKQKKSSYKALFYPWHDHPEYSIPCTNKEALKLFENLDAEEENGRRDFGWTAGQLLWRRKAIADKCEGDLLKFHQEYPSYDREAFLTSGRPVFDQRLLEARRAAADVEPVAFTGHLLYDATATP